MGLPNVSNLASAMPARPGMPTMGQGEMNRGAPQQMGAGGNMSWLAPIVQMMQQRAQMQQRMQGASRFAGNQGGLFNMPMQRPQMPQARPAMPQQSMFTPVQQPQRTPFAPYQPPAPPPAPPMASIPGMTQDQLMQWARSSPGSPLYDQHYAGYSDYGNGNSGL